MGGVVGADVGGGVPGGPRDPLPVAFALRVVLGVAPIAVVFAAVAVGLVALVVDVVARDLTSWLPVGVGEPDAGGLLVGPVAVLDGQVGGVPGAGGVPGGGQRLALGVGQVCEQPSLAAGRP